MTWSKWLRWMGLFATALHGVGCASSNTDTDFGRAYAEARTRQTENPGASEKLVQTEEIGPGTSKEVLSNYHRNQDTAVQEQRQRRQRQNGLADTSAH